MASSRFVDSDTDNKGLPPIHGYQTYSLLPLEEAVQPIVPQIPGLMEQVKYAKEHCYKNSEHGLTTDESASIYLYTMEWGDHSLYKVLNNALHSENRLDLKPWFGYLKLFLTALNKLPSDKEIVWRGTKIKRSSNFKKNNEITWWGISSCAKENAVIKSFLNPNGDSTIFMIEALNGKSIAEYSRYPNESEILLRPGTRLLVKSDVLEYVGSYTIHLRELNDNERVHNTSSSIIQKFATAFGCIFAGVIFYPIAVRLRDIGFYAGLTAASPYPPVPLNHLERFTMTISPVLDRAGIFCGALCAIGLGIGVKIYFKPSQRTNAL